MKVVIPAKSNSKRVPNKNFRPFYRGLSLFDIKARQVLECMDAGDVYVSSENPDIAPVVENYGFHFILRDERLTYNETPITEFVPGVIADVPGDDDIMWVQVTDPVFSDHVGALSAWERARSDHDSLVTVRPFRDYLLDSRGLPVNCEYGDWHIPSTELPLLYLWTFACQILTRQAIQRTRYYVGAKPYLHVSTAPTVDIDDMTDFQIAGAIYGKWIERTPDAN